MKDHFTDGKIPLLSDGGLKSAAEELTPSYGICGAHTFACVSKRTVTKHLHYADLDEMWITVQQLLQNSNRKHNIKEGKKTVRLSLNDYIVKQVVTETDQIHIAKLKDKTFNDRTETEKKEIAAKIVNYGSVVNYFEIRFRSLHESLLSLLMVSNVLKKLQTRSCKPEFALIKDYQIDLDFVEALHAFAEIIRTRLHIIYIFILLTVSVNFNID